MERVGAIRCDKAVGKGSCTSIDECYSDVELVEELDREGVKTPEEAVRWAREREGLWLEKGTNASSGEPDCPLVEAHKRWVKEWGWDR